MIKMIGIPMILMLTLLLGACGSGAPAAAPATTLPPIPATAPATSTLAPTPTAVPQVVRPPHSIDLGEGRWLVTHSFETQNKAGYYSIKAQWPVIEGATTPQIEQFNLAAQQLVSDTLRSFQQEQSAPLPDPGGFIFVNYQVVNADNGLLSILFDVSTYTGGAHNNTTHIPLNFDLNTGQALTLNDVFKPGVDAVSNLAVLASDELTRTNRLVFPDGAKPTPENYRVWNFDYNNLLITFEEYQVMPFSAGPQTVAIPYYRLKEVLNPDSPLADYWQLTQR